MTEAKNDAAMEKADDPTKRLANFFRANLANQLAIALPKHMTPERMSRICLTAIRTVKDLHRCSTESFAASILTLGQLGLEPNTPLGHAWLIPRKAKGGGHECTVMIGYQGYLDLARRSGLVRTIYSHVVREGDDFDYELGLYKRLVHRPKAPVAAPITHVYAVAHIADAEPLFEVLTIDEIEARRMRGASGMNFSTPWDTDYPAMAKKSGVRALWAWLPKSAEMALAAEAEENEPIQPRAPALASGTINSINRALASTVADAPALPPLEDQSPLEELIEMDLPLVEDDVSFVSWFKRALPLSTGEATRKRIWDAALARGEQIGMADRDLRPLIDEAKAELAKA